MEGSTLSSRRRSRIAQRLELARDVLRNLGRGSAPRILPYPHRGNQRLVHSADGTVEVEAPGRRSSGASAFLGFVTPVEQRLCRHSFAAARHRGSCRSEEDALVARDLRLERVNSSLDARAIRGRLAFAVRPPSPVHTDTYAFNRASIRSKKPFQPSFAPSYSSGRMCPRCSKCISVRSEPRSLRTTVTSS